jgi:general secretion pathway protein G
MRARKGFTLVEILIVVVILGILAAIVIPQFSDASTQSKLSSCRTTLQSLRSQIELYKIQHNDIPPAILTFEAQMTTYSDANGGTAAAKDATHIYGPYMQRVPVNPWNDTDTLAAADGAGVGWVYDEATGAMYIGVADVTNADVVTELQDSGDAL